MSNTPIQRKPAPKLDRVLAAHERRARLIAELHEQAIVTANASFGSAQGVFRAGTAKDAGRGKAEAWFCAGVFLLALGCIVAVGCILVTTVSWQ